MECRRVRRSATDTAGFAAEDLRERGYVVEPLNLIVMDYSVLLQKYAPVASDSLVESVVAKARAEMDRNRNEEVYRFCFSALDLTTLSGSDSVRSVAEFVKKAVDVPVRFPGMPNVATVCVYPSFVDIAGLGVEGTNIGVTSVAGGFPAAQTYLEVKMLEVAMAVENGADEIDVVMNAGEMVEGEFDRLANDLELLCREAGQEVTFKVIIESGMLETPEDVYRASMLAILSGADFVKTSTGKSAYGATPKSAMVICNAIKDYYLQTGINVGIKLAGGIRTVDDAVLYYTIVENMLGREWLTPSLFRFGGKCSVSQRFAVGRNGRYTVLLLNLRLFGNCSEISGAQDNRCICKAGPPKVSFGGPALQMGRRFPESNLIFMRTQPTAGRTAHSQEDRAKDCRIHRHISLCRMAIWIPFCESGRPFGKACYRKNKYRGKAGASSACATCHPYVR